MQVVHSLSKLTFQMKKICPAQWFTVRNLQFILVKSYSMPVDIPTHNLCDQNSKHCNIRASMILKVLTWIGFFFYICLFGFFFFLSFFVVDGVLKAWLGWLSQTMVLFMLFGIRKRIVATAVVNMQARVMRNWPKLRKGWDW